MTLYSFENFTCSSVTVNNYTPPATGTQYPSNPVGVLLHYSSTELVDVARDMVPYYHTYREQRNGTWYDVVCFQAYYPHNYAIGLGWELNPTSEALGYHQHDVEYLLLYYLNGSPVKVYFSEHGLSEGTWCDYGECEFGSGYLVTYAARNSHANYPSAGLKRRLYDTANDVCDSDGAMIVVSWAEMNPAVAQNYGSCALYQSNRPYPPDVTLTADERYYRLS